MAIANGYASLAEVKAAARITDTVDDTLLEIAIESASRAIDGHTHRNFFVAGTVATARVFAATNSDFVWVDDFASTSGFVLATSDNLDAVYSTTWGTADYQLEPLNGVSDGVSWPYTRIRSTGNKGFPYGSSLAGVQVTARWGWSAVPTAIKQACIILAGRQFKRYDSPLGVAGFGDLGAMRVSRVDPDVATLIEPYVLSRNLV